MKQLILITRQSIWSRLKKPSFLRPATYFKKEDYLALVWEGENVADEFHAWWESLHIECTEFFVVSHDGTEDGKEPYGCFHDHPFELNQTIKISVK